MRLPWAKRGHFHADENLFKYASCSECGHLILSGYADNRRVRISFAHMETGRIYGSSCAPSFDLLEISRDGVPRYFFEGVLVDAPVVPRSIQEELPEWIDEVNRRVAEEAESRMNRERS